MAVEKGRPDVLCLLLDRYNKYGWNLLHLVVVFDKLDMVKTMKHEVPQYGCQMDNMGRTPLDLAFYKCNAQMVKLLLELGCLNNYGVSDIRLLGHHVVASSTIDKKKSRTEDWISILDGMLLKKIFDPKAED